jgi:hypothetical protein
LGIRQSVNENPVIAGSVAGVIIVSILLFLVVRSCSSAPDPMEGSGATKAFFSTDDGKTWFADDAKRIPPYTVDKPGDPNHGKVAWGARVARCGGGAPFVWTLEKYSDADKQKLEELLKQQGDKAKGLPQGYMSGAYAMLKKPGTGDKGWLKLDVGNTVQYAEMAQPKCPDGGKAEVVSAD